MTARCSHLMLDGGNEWPVGLSRPFANVGPLLRYTRGECACTVETPPRPGGPCGPLSGARPDEAGGMPRNGPQSERPAVSAGAAHKVVPAPQASSRALF